MRFKPGDIAVHKADMYPTLGNPRFLVVSVGLMEDIDGGKTEMLWLDNNSSMPFIKSAAYFYTPSEIKIMTELEKSK